MSQTAEADTQISSCKMCAHPFKWDASKHDSIPDYCDDCRSGDPPTVYHD